MRLKLLFATIFMLVYGFWSLYRVWGIHQTQIAARDLEQGANAAGVWLKLRDCRALWSRGATIDDQGTSIIPVVSDGWQSGDPVAVLMQVRIQQLKRQDDSPGSSCEGTVPFGRGVGSSMVRAMGQQGITVTRNCILLSGGGNAQTERDRAFVGIYIGLGTAALLQIIGWLLPRQKKDQSPDQGQRLVRRRTRLKSTA